MYVEHPNVVPQNNYFEFHLTVHNTGSENSVIRKFDLDVPDQGAFEDLAPIRRNMIPTRGAQRMTQFNEILARTYITVPAHDTWTGITMFEVPAMPIHTPRVRCTLKLTDSNGTSASHTFFDMPIQD